MCDPYLSALEAFVKTRYTNLLYLYLYLRWPVTAITHVYFSLHVHTSTMSTWAREVDMVDVCTWNDDRNGTPYLPFKGTQSKGHNANRKLMGGFLSDLH